MTIEYPPVSKRLESVKDWAIWATGATVAWRDQNDGGRVREANEVWCVLRPTKISKIGIDETISLDVDNVDGDAESPRQDVTISLRKIDIEFRAMSRSQEHEDSAWNALLNAHTKIYSKYGAAKYFKPACLSLNSVSDIINMPNLRNLDMRTEDVALFSMTLNTTLSDMDAAAVGTYIESVTISSDLKDAGGDSLPASIQLVNEVLP